MREIQLKRFQGDCDFIKPWVKLELWALIFKDWLLVRNTTLYEWCIYSAVPLTL